MPEYLVHGSKLKTYDSNGHPIVRATSYSFITESNQGRVTTVEYTEADTYLRYFYYPQTKTVRLETTVQKENCSPRQKPTNHTTITNKFLQPHEIPETVLQKLKQ